eukprot:Opistho-2@24272
MSTLTVPGAKKTAGGTMRRRAYSQRIQSPQAEQLVRLQAKSQAEYELLEDVRQFVKARAQLDADYAQGLQKLTAQFLTKRKWPGNPKIPSHKECRSGLSAFKSVLEETERMGKQRGIVSEKLLASIAEPIRPQQNQKKQTLKKCIDQHHRLQEELAKSNQEYDKAVKTYTELERVAQMARDKFAEMEERYKKKTLRFFESKSELEKKYNKAMDKVLLCERRAQYARHENILTVSATNAHQSLFYKSFLPNLMDTLDGDFFDRLRDYFTAYGSIEREALNQNLASSIVIVDEGSLVDRHYELQLFLLENAAPFTEPPPLVFLPLETDKITDIVLDENSQPQLTKEMQKLVNTVARINKRILAEEKGMAGLVQMAAVYQKQPEFATAEAQLETEQKIEELQNTIRDLELQKAKTQAKIDKIGLVGIHVEDFSAQQEDEFAETRMRSASMSSGDGLSRSFKARKAVALYEYKAAAADELSIEEDEQLTIIEDQNDGWVKGRNARGQIGIFPASYIEYTEDPVDDEPTTPARSPGSTSSGPALGGASKGKVVALFDYEAQSPEELSFSAGDSIELLSRDTGVDDGWWEGRCHGRRGVFPSLLVEDCEDDEEDF